MNNTEEGKKQKMFENPTWKDKLEKYMDKAL